MTVYTENINGGRLKKSGSTATGRGEKLTHHQHIESTFFEMGRGLDFGLRCIYQDYLSDAVRMRRTGREALIAESWN
jgi:hypothetical protein